MLGNTPVTHCQLPRHLVEILENEKGNLNHTEKTSRIPTLDPHDSSLLVETCQTKSSVRNTLAVWQYRQFRVDTGVTQDITADHPLRATSGSWVPPSIDSVRIKTTCQ